MNSYKQHLSKVDGIKNQLKAKRKEILESGRDAGWQRQRLQEATSNAFGDLGKVSLEMKTLAEEYEKAALDIAREATRKPWPTKDPINYEQLNFHKGLAFDIFRSHKKEDIPAALDKALGELNGNELSCKWVYETAAAQVINDPTYDMTINEIVDKHKTNYEKAAEVELDRRRRFLSHDKTLRGMAEEDLKSIAEGDEPLYENTYTLYDELMANIE